MALFLQMLLTGIVVGGIYALLALGFVLIYKSSKIFNFAQGQFLTLGGYFGWAFLVQLGLPLWLTFVFVFIVCYLLGLLVERVFMRPMIGQPVLSAIMMTIGLTYVLDAVINGVWRGEVQSYPPVFPQATVSFLEANLTLQYIILFIVALGLIGFFIFFFGRTRSGLHMRAVAEGHLLSQSLGINVKQVFALSWAIAAVTAGIGGMLLASITGVGAANTAYGIKIFPVVILGGLESVPGVIVGGIVIGILQYLTMGFLDPLTGLGLGDVVPFIIMIGILLFKPYGLFGLVRIERV